MSVPELDIRALLDGKSGPCHDFIEREQGGHRAFIGFFHPPAVSMTDEEAEALIDERFEARLTFREAKPIRASGNVVASVWPQDWAFVRTYGVPEYDTASFSPHHKYTGYSEEGVRNVMATHGLVPGTAKHLARIVKAHRMGQLPLPFAMEIAQIGAQARRGMGWYWLSWQTDHQSPRPLRPRRLGDVNGHLGLPGFLWSTVYLGIPSSEFA